jgi:hypothetical protein
MSGGERNGDYDGSHYMGGVYSADTSMLSAQSSNSNTTLSPDYSTPGAMSTAQPYYPWMDPTMHAQPSHYGMQSQDWYQGGIMPELSTSQAMMAELDISRSTGQGVSPLESEDFSSRRESIASHPEIAEWQEKVRTEVRQRSGGSTNEC